MKLIKGLENFFIDKGSAITIGNFDGVHIGHSEIIKKVVSLARENDLLSIVVTFDPHPVKFFGEEILLLTDLEKKNELLEELGVDCHLVLNFNKELMSMDPEVFVREIIVKRLKAKYVVVGYDYRFGARRKGDFELLKIFSKKYGYEAIKHEKIILDNLTVSSSNIRKLLKDGELKLASSMLGRFYSIIGKVIKGDGIGRLLSYPTANIKVIEYQTPKNGTYATKIKIKDIMYDSVTNVGFRPTIPGNHELRIETHIFDFNNDIYDEKVELFFVDYLREEKKFESFDELKVQISEDCKRAKYILKGNV
ncbi:MAG: bifunctional riboflavin kinase/FAD synthetase [Calditerrivibrio sp.]|nr:bifunctional riboflavin kinase/FAD synthetase [Calditerrivibrio sp.]